MILFIAQTLLEKSSNTHYINRYLKFVDTRIDRGKINGERHHILPKCIFPEYKNLQIYKWNGIYLTEREHFLAHWMLAKILGGKAWYAFQIMKRVGNNSILYEQGRKYISEVISKNNKGRKRTAEQKLHQSIILKGKLTAKDKMNNTFWISSSDSRLLSGELQHICTGVKKSTEAKKKIGFKNKGNKAYINDLGIIQMFKDKSLVPENFRPYIPINTWTKDSIWVYNQSTLEQVRLLKGSEIPAGYVRGRINGPGFSKINNSNRKKYINLKTKKYDFLSADAVTSFHYPFDGTLLEKIPFYVYKKYFVIGHKNMLSLLSSLGIDLPYYYISNINLAFPKPHHNTKSSRRTFFEQYSGKTLKMLGVEKYNINEITWEGFIDELNLYY